MSSMENLGYERTRTLLLGAGVVVLVITALFAFLRGVDPVEVAGVVLFLPVFAAAVFSGLRGGLLAGGIAAALYVLLRSQSLPLQTFSQILPTVSLRVLGYLVFGGLGGWASGIVTRGIDKLERFDVTDADSELLNARGLHQQLGQELARAQRYGSDFAVVLVSFDAGEDPRPRRHAVGAALRRSLRAVDDIGRVRAGRQDEMIAVLPETPAAGAAIVAAKVEDQLRQTMGQGHEAQVRWLTHGQDEQDLTELMKRLDRLVKEQFPGA
jgi:GGDEF domain-containing protein